MEEIKHWGLMGRLMSLVVLAVGLTLLLFFTLTVWRLETGAERNSQEVEKLAWQRISAQMRLQYRLVDTEIDQMAGTMSQQVEQFSRQTETGRVLARGNVVAIDLMLQKVAQAAGVDGLLALDANLNAIGSDEPGLPLLKANLAFAESGFVRLARPLMAQESRSTPRHYTGFAVVEDHVLHRFGTFAQGKQLVLISIHPVFDDFGDVVALVVAHRLMSRSIPVLRQFAKDEHIRISVSSGAAILMDIAPDLKIKRAPSHVALGDMGINEQEDTLYKCSLFQKNWRLCITQPYGDLKELTRQFKVHIEYEKQSLALWLALLGLGGILLALLICFIVARRVLAPLGQITDAVRSVAKGNWLVHVAGQKRGDEVGAIARSVVVLQRSMKERERLKADMADVDQLLAERKTMNEAARQCQSSLRQELVVLSEGVENLEAEITQLQHRSSDAIGKTDEAVLVTQRNFANLTDENSDGAAANILECLDRITDAITTMRDSNEASSAHAVRVVERLSQVERVVDQFIQQLMHGDGMAVSSITPIAEVQERLLNGVSLHRVALM